MSDRAHKPASRRAEVSIDLDQARPVGSNKLAIPARVRATNLPAAVAAEMYRMDPRRLKQILVRQTLGTDRGIRYEIAMRTMRLRDAQMRCDGCEQTFPLATTDFSGWAHSAHTRSDLCPDCQ